jgi:hypothetical protein
MEAAEDTSNLASRMASGRPRLVRKTSPQRGEKQYGRSSITNGDNLLRDVDGRSPLYRRYRDIANAILADQAGVEQCSEARKQLIRRFAAAAVLAEQMEARLARGEEIDIAEHATLSSTQVRLAARIGIDRLQRDVTPLSYRDRIALEVEAEADAEAERKPPATVVADGPPTPPLAPERTSDAPTGSQAYPTEDGEEVP